MLSLLMFVVKTKIFSLQTMKITI